MKILFLLIFAFVTKVIASERPLPYFSANDRTPYWSQQHNEKPATVTAFKATNQDNKPVTDVNFAGKISLVNFFFADCTTVCPTMMHSISEFQKKVDGVQIYSFSVRPEKDSPEMLMHFAHHHDLDLANWTLVTGTHDEIYRIGREIFKAEGATGQPKPAFIHTNKIYLVDQDKHIRGIYDTSSSKAMSLLAKDIERLKN